MNLLVILFFVQQYRLQVHLQVLVALPKLCQIPCLDLLLHKHSIFHICVNPCCEVRSMKSDYLLLQEDMSPVHVDEAPRRSNTMDIILAFLLRRLVNLFSNDMVHKGIIPVLRVRILNVVFKVDAGLNR